MSSDPDLPVCHMEGSVNLIGAVEKLMARIEELIAVVKELVGDDDYTEEDDESTEEETIEESSPAKDSKIESLPQSRTLSRSTHCSLLVPRA